MFRGNYWRIASLLVVTLLICLALPASAQETAGTLTLGQPSIANVAAGETLAFNYALAEARAVSLQALGEATPPTITILRDGEVVAAQPNTNGDLIVALTTFLPAGSYTVEVGSANNTAGTVILVLQSEMPITPITLTAGAVESGSVNLDAAIALYSFNALPEPAFLYIESGLPDSSPNVRILNTTTGSVSGEFGADVTGARLRFPAGSATYQVAVTHSGSASVESFTICLVAVSADGCEQSAETPIEAPAATPEVQVQSTLCTVSSSAGGPVNIRQSASTSTVIVGALPAGSNADVSGISPDGGFYNILFNGINGWVSLSVVTASGDCGNVAVVNPPPFSVPPTQPPAQPTTPPTQPPTGVPTNPPTATATQSGPCLISVVSPVNVYLLPVEQVDYLYDQVGTGGQLIPTGRLADNSWWQTNYASAWIQTSRFGNEVTVSGDCSSLPVVTP